MQEKETNELERELGSTHLADYSSFVHKNKDSMLSDATSFSTYIKTILREKGITQQIAFLKADIPERYGYKLLSGEKHTRQRDTILRLCLAAGFRLEEVQEALILYGMAPLHGRLARDAVLTVAIQNGIYDLCAVNRLLESCGQAPLIENYE